MLWNKYRVCHYRETDPSKFYDSRFKAWRVGYSRHSFTTWFSSLPEYRLDWILKVIVSLHPFFYSQGIWTLNHPTFMERISIELNLKGYQGLLLSAMFLTKWTLSKCFLYQLGTLKQTYSGLFSSLLRLFLRIVLSQRTALISRDLLVYLLTSLIEFLISSQPKSTQWLKTKLKQELDYNAKRH